MPNWSEHSCTLYLCSIFKLARICSDQKQCRTKTAVPKQHTHRVFKAAKLSNQMECKAKFLNTHWCVKRLCASSLGAHNRAVQLVRRGHFVRPALIGTNLAEIQNLPSSSPNSEEIHLHDMKVGAGIRQKREREHKWTVWLALNFQRSNSCQSRTSLVLNPFVSLLAFYR